MKGPPLGYKTALTALRRGDFFLSPDDDLPTGRSELIRNGDLVPQFGFVGPRYAERRVLILGINPGNGNDLVRSTSDERMIPVLSKFFREPSEQNFIDAQRAYRTECESWHVWKRHCSQVIGAGKLSLDEIAYGNCLPYRTASESAFDDAVAAAAARLYVGPLVAELRPKVVVALGKRAREIIDRAPVSKAHVLTWNRAQAATPAVLQDRQQCAEEIFRTLNA